MTHSGSIFDRMCRDVFLYCFFFFFANNEFISRGLCIFFSVCCLISLFVCCKSHTVHKCALRAKLRLFIIKTDLCSYLSALRGYSVLYTEATNLGALHRMRLVIEV
jgi:hypothetical protein